MLIPYSAGLLKVFVICGLFLNHGKPTNVESGQSRSNNVTIVFNHRVGAQQLHLDSSYTNAFGELFRVRQLKYYISNIEFHGRERSNFHKVPESYYLIEETRPASRIIPLSIPDDEYIRVSFLIGVDSVKNISGAQSGVLDPLNGMFWTWNTGYIMAKLEGSSPVSTLPRKMFEFHIGGYRYPHNVMRRIELSIPANLTRVGRDHPVSIPVSVDLNVWFAGQHSLSLSKYPACTAPGLLATQYADNYARMFMTE